MGALLFFQSYRNINWSICGFFGLLLWGAFDPSGPPSGNASALPLDRLADVVQRGEMWKSTIFHLMLHIIHVHVLHPKLSAVRYQSTNYGWLRLVSYYFQDIQEVTVPLSVYCTLSHQLSQSTKFLFQDFLSYLIAEGWSGRRWPL